MDSEHRPLRPEEKKLIEKLLEKDFPGRDELRRQLDSVTAKRLDDDGSLTLAVTAGPPAPGRWRVPTEGWCNDIDGMEIQVLLHVKDGMMIMLEIFKLDGSKVSRPPNPEEMGLFQPGPI